MTKEEFLAIAAARYEALKGLEQHDNFYDFEKEFDRLWIEFGRDVMEKTLGDMPTDRRKKKDPNPIRLRRDG